MDMFIDLTAENSDDSDEDTTLVCKNADVDFMVTSTSTSALMTAGCVTSGNSSSNYTYTSTTSFQPTSKNKKPEYSEELINSPSPEPGISGFNTSAITLAPPTENDWRYEDYLDTGDTCESGRQSSASSVDEDLGWPPVSAEPQKDSDSENDVEVDGSQDSLRSYHPLSDSEHSDSDILMPPPIKKKPAAGKQKTTKPTANNNQEGASNKGRKRKTAEEREAEKSAKEERKRKREELTRLRPKNCLRYIRVEVDSAITAIPALSAVLLAPPISQIQSTVCDRDVPFSVGWVRELQPGPQGEEREERSELMLQVLEMEMVKNLIQLDQLSNHVAELISSQPSTNRAAFLIYGSQQYFSSQQKSKKKNPDVITKAQLEEAIACCELDLKVTFRLVESAQEVGEWLYRYSKAVAEKHFKAQKEGSWQENFRFHLASEKGPNIRVGTATALGLPHLWLQALKKFRRVTPEACQAIVDLYPSPTAIITAYENCNSEAEARNLLQNIVFQKTQGPLAVQRRIGPVLSRKFHTLLTSTDPNTLLAS